MPDVTSRTVAPRPTRRPSERPPARRKVSASRASVQTPAQLRSAITAHVRGRCAEGAPLEQVLIEVRALLQRTKVLEASPDELRVLPAHVREWSFDAYVSGAELQHAPIFY
jgi:hypothetical protein